VYTCLLQGVTKLRKILFVAALAAQAAACSKSSDVEERVRFIAAGVQAITPKDLGHDVMLTSAKAEGKTLVLAFRGIGSRDSAALNAELKKVACSDPAYRSLLDKGAAIRFEMSSYDGSESPPATVANCDA
jgi:hypothetical protein